MRLVVADTSPVNYLLLIDSIEVLRHLYGRVVIPAEVFEELTALGAPARVRAWMQAPPLWLQVEAPQAADTPLPDLARFRLDAGELAAIRLALTEGDSLLLIDEARGRQAAAALGLENTGTLGILADAAKEGWIDLPAAFERLRATSFRVSQTLVNKILREAGH